MAIEFPCAGCQKLLRVPDEHAGKQARCPHCQSISPVPAKSQSGGDAAVEKSDAGVSLSKPSSSFSEPTPGESTFESSYQPDAATGSHSIGKDDFWYVKIEDGQQFGPVDKIVLDQWLAEGRLTAACQVLRDGESKWRPAAELYPSLAMGAQTVHSPNPFADRDETVNPYAAPQEPFAINPHLHRNRYLKPHRGAAVLILGILGFCCCIFAALAWGMGQADLNDMRAGRMDPSGKGLTQAGMICGIIGVIFALFRVVLQGVIELPAFR